MTAKTRLDAALAEAARLRDAGDHAAAAAALAALAADPGLAALPPVTALGLNRRLHAARLSLAKRQGDAVARLGLQAHLVPPPDVLAPFARAAQADRSAILAANGRPVPRLLHQIWIGPRPLPPTLAAWSAHAARLGYAHRLWREADLAAEGLDAHPVFRARLAAGDYPGAVDAARYGILARHGGIYLDADWYPARMDAGFHDRIPMQGLVALAEPTPRLTGQGALLLANSVIAAPSGHPVLARLDAILPAVQAALPNAPAWWSTGPLIFTLIARAGAMVLADPGLVAGTLPGTATLAEAEARAARAAAADEGLLLAWKPW